MDFTFTTWASRALEGVGLLLAILDFSGLSTRLEMRLDQRREKLRAWLHADSMSARAEKVIEIITTKKPTMMFFTILLTLLAYMVVFSNVFVLYGIFGDGMQSLLDAYAKDAEKFFGMIAWSVIVALITVGVFP